MSNDFVKNVISLYKDYCVGAIEGFIKFTPITFLAGIPMALIGAIMVKNQK